MNKLAQLEQQLAEIQTEIEKLKQVDTRSDRAKSWDRVEKREEYYCIGSVEVCISEEENIYEDRCHYEIANYNTDEAYMERIKFEQDLFRKLKRFADKNNECEIKWGDKSLKYCIMRDNGKIECWNYTYGQSFGQVYFTSKQIAEKAIETFKTELEQYFCG